VSGNFHGRLEFGGSDLEFLRPIANFIRLAERDERSIACLMLLQLDVSATFFDECPTFLTAYFSFAGVTLNFFDQ
jgi:hypothetical protein